MAESGPARMKTARNELRVRTAKPFRRLKGAIRTTLIENDALQLKQETSPLTAAADDIKPSRGFRFSTDAEAQDKFMDWLDEQIDRGILKSAERSRIRNGEHYTARYIRSAYSRGVDHADTQLNEHGLETPDDELQRTFNRPIAQKDLERLYTRTFDELESVTSDMRTAVRRELSTGFSQGWGPRRMASNLNDRVDKIGITDAERLARTEVMNAHNTANRSRYSEYGVKKVDILGSSPCAKICAPIIANNPYPLDNIPRGGCPLHPNCVGTEAPATDDSGNVMLASANDLARTAA